MKRMISILLMVGLLLGLVACGNKPAVENTAASLQVGFGRSVITPPKGVPLAGFGNTSTRLSKNVLDDLYATCVAVTDAEGDTVLLISQDIIGASQQAMVRNSVCMATGVPQNRIFLAGTHTHSAPDQQSKAESIAAYNGLYLRRVVEAAKAAMEDRTPATIRTGSVNTQGLNFVRHYLMNDGTYAGDNFGSWDSGIKDHAEPNDPQLQLVEFAREGKQSVLMVNWQVHPKMTGGTTKYDVSADIVGFTRSYVEKQTGDLMIYFTGAAGNQNPSSRIADETPTEDVQRYSQQLGAYVLQARQNMTPVEGGRVETKQTVFDAQVDLLMQDKLEEAKQVQAVYKEKGRDEGNVLAREYGFSSVYHANAVINRSSYGKSQKVEVNAISIGNIGFVTASYEMFASHGATIKAQSPYDTTFVITCCNGSNGYIPTQAAHEYGCYESHTGRFVPGTGEELVKIHIANLTELKNN